MKEKKEKGSLSIFSALILLLVASLLFTFLESARMYGLRAKSHRNTMLCAESALAEYQIELLENYESFKIATEAENKAQNEFDIATSELKKIQKTQEKQLSHYQVL